MAGFNYTWDGTLKDIVLATTTAAAGSNTFDFGERVKSIYCQNNTAAAINISWDSQAVTAANPAVPSTATVARTSAGAGDIQIAVGATFSRQVMCRKVFLNLLNGTKINDPANAGVWLMGGLGGPRL